MHQTLQASVWRSNLQNLHCADDVDSISETVESVLDELADLGPKSINLESMDFSGVNAAHLVTLLRTTFNWREEAPGWYARLVS